MLIAHSRTLPVVFAPAVDVTVALPIPTLPELIVIHDSSLGLASPRATLLNEEVETAGAQCARPTGFMNFHHLTNRATRKSIALIFQTAPEIDSATSLATRSASLMQSPVETPCR